MLLELLGQTAAQQIEKEDPDNYEPSTGKVKRSIYERGFDTFFNRTDAIKEEAGKKYVKDLENSAVGEALLTLDPTAEITSSTKKTALRKLYRDTKAKDELRTAILNKGYTDKTGSQLMEMDEAALRPILEQATSDKGKRDYKTNPAVIEERSRYDDRQSREDIARKDRISQRMSDRELAMMKLDIEKQGQANQLSMYDKNLAYQSKLDQRQRMAGIIAGLSSLGAAFAI